MGRRLHLGATGPIRVLAGLRAGGMGVRGTHGTWPKMGHPQAPNLRSPLNPTPRSPTPTRTPLVSFTLRTVKQSLYLYFLLCVQPTRPSPILNGIISPQIWNVTFSTPFLTPPIVQPTTLFGQIAISVSTPDQNIVSFSIGPFICLFNILQNLNFLWSEKKTFENKKRKYVPFKM